MGVCLGVSESVLYLGDACRLVHARHDGFCHLPGQLLCHPLNMVLHVRQIERGVVLVAPAT